MVLLKFKNPWGNKLRTNTQHQGVSHTEYIMRTSLSQQYLRHTLSFIIIWNTLFMHFLKFLVLAYCNYKLFPCTMCHEILYWDIHTFYKIWASTLTGIAFCGEKFNQRDSLHEYTCAFLWSLTSVCFFKNWLNFFYADKPSSFAFTREKLTVMGMAFKKAISQFF